MATYTCMSTITGLLQCTFSLPLLLHPLNMQEEHCIRVLRGLFYYLLDITINTNTGQRSQLSCIQ